jgi:hypothetical protein
MAFLTTPLRRFGFRMPAITRFDSTEVYIADRVADTSAYAQLFGRFTPFEGKNFFRALSEVGKMCSEERS